MIAIPAIDIMDGACVRLVKGLFNQKKPIPKTPWILQKHLKTKGSPTCTWWIWMAPGWANLSI